MRYDIVTHKRGKWWIAEIPSIQVPSAKGPGMTIPHCYATTRKLAIEGVLKIVELFPSTDHPNISNQKEDDVPASLPLI